MDSFVIKSGGLKLAAWRHPPKINQPPKCRIILVHGMGEHSARHLNTIEKLTERLPVEVLRFDLRGMGASDGERMWVNDWEDYLTDVGSIFQWIQESLEPLPLILFGHSMGGTIALDFAVRRQKHLKALFLSAPAFRLPTNLVTKIKILVGRWIVPALPHLRIPSSISPQSLSRDPQVIEAYLKDPLNCHFNTVRQGVLFLKAASGIAALASQLELPVKIFHGDADLLVSFSGSEELVSLIHGGNGELIRVNGGYHELHNDLGREQYFEGLVDKVREFC